MSQAEIASSSTPSPAATAGPDAGRWRRIPALLVLAGLWAWAIAGCTDEWLDNPMYSYGWFVPPLMLFFAWRRLDEPIAGRELLGDPALPDPRHRLLLAAGAAFLALFVLPGELLRNELPDDRLNNWCLALVAVGYTLWLLRWLGGARLVRTLAFPVLFFLTAVAWPKRYENPVTLGLQGFVTDFVVEVMHVVGIHADPHGNSIYLRNGPVGIAEACSGIRSLQASLMISLAIGELFYLRRGRRCLLVALCAGLATLLNLGRTLALCLLTEYHGAEAMHRFHDAIGNAVILGLPVLAWITGQLLTRRGGCLPSAPHPRKPGPDGTPPPIHPLTRIRAQARALPWRLAPNLLPALVLGLAGFSTYHAWLYWLDLHDPPQQTPFFLAQPGADTGIQTTEVNPEVWATLAPTSGESFSVRLPDNPHARISLYHFFWKPAAANRWVTGHRPDVCMPAGGWKKDGEVEPVDIDLHGQRLRFSLFRFAGVGERAVQIWGIWRNGQPVQMEFFRNPTLEWSLLTGKSRSAVEVVSCVVPYTDGEAPVDLAKQLLAATFGYRRPGPASLATTTTTTTAPSAPATSPAATTPSPSAGTPSAPARP